MKSVTSARIHQYGGPEVVRIESASLPEPRQGQLLVRVRAAGVNPIDWKIRQGYLQKMMPLPLPFTLGGDFSGTVEAVGPGGSPFTIGEEIYGQAPVMMGGSGSFAEGVIAPAGSSARKPRSIAHPEAAALPLAGVSALQALTEHLRLAAGQKILIHGGAGAIGSLAVQLARYIGATVVTTVGTKNVEYAKSLGAQEVIDHRTQSFEDVGRSIDAVLDTVGGETYTRSFRILKRGGRLVSLLERPREDLAQEFGVEALMQITKVTTERLVKLTELVERGVLKVHIDKMFPLHAAAAALRHLEQGSLRGKVVLTVP
ncbi:MAG TPA: NADP-dependent oxidoreductase [Steroidobacteraceae bacterium]|nr:NADP-dependent oxidoreductase [Steroidobacteraceae bacterium]